MVSKAITSQSNLSSDTMQDVPDHQLQADSRATTFDQVIPAPAQPVYRPDPLEELLRLKQQLGQFMQKYEIDFDEGTDPTAVLQELERRARAAGERSSGGIFKELNMHGRLGSAAPVTPQSIPPDSRSLTEGVRYGVGQYRIWAVLIGIDAYKEYPLHGCVSDALLMKRFLTDDLGVPETHIKCLLGPRDPNSADPKSIRPTRAHIVNTLYSFLGSKGPNFADLKSTPSRANIVNTLYSLANNPEIIRGDNIIIYYAGHGNCTNHDPESRCDYSCPIEALCPMDRGTQDADGNEIPDISDREFNILFGLICRAKGHKITFIVDANYSGRMSRGQLPIETSTKVESILHAVDERWEDLPGYRSVLSKDWQPDTGSHVTLAACFAEEMQRENGSWGGKFTDALLHVLRSTDWKEEMTYVDLINLMNRLPVPLKRMRRPLVSGKRMNERLWN